MAVNTLEYVPGRDTTAWRLVPEHIRGALDRYLMHGIAPGGFLQSVICNDLGGAVGRADRVNVARLADIVRFMQWYAPADSWGSELTYLAWLERGGISGLGTQHARERQKDASDSGASGPEHP